MKKILREDIQKQRRLMNLQEQEKSWGDIFYDYVSKGLKALGGEEPSPSKPKKDESSYIDYLFTRIIDDIEGGYYHPNMLYDGRIKSKGRMGKSGETMYGIDRKTGDEINRTSQGRQFWGIIDLAGAANKWPYLYMGGNLESVLKPLAVRMLKDRFENYSKNLDKETLEIVRSDRGLLLHMGYAAWNGSTWFQKFADSLDNEVARGNKDPKKLLAKGLRDRKNSTNSLISDSAEKLEKILGTNLV